MTIQAATYLPPTITSLTQATDQLSSQYSAEQAAISSGVTSDSYAGLGDQRYQALNLQPQITKLGAYQQNVASAQNTLTVSQTALSQITSIATNLQTSLLSLKGNSSSINVATAALQARQALTQLGSLLNTRDGSGYVFAGNDSTNAPVTDPSSILQGSFFTTIASSVAAVGTTGAAAAETATLAAAADNAPGASPFSTALSVDGTSAASLTHTVTVGDQDHVAVGFVATAGGPATASSTGSSIRDLARALATVGSLDQADATSGGFATLVSDTSSQFAGVTASLTTSVATLGQTQAQLTTQTSDLSLTSDALTKQLGLVKDSDPASLSTQLTQTQNQLQASYSLIADLKGLTLASYL